MQNLDNRTPIVNPDGTPTQLFMRLFQQRGEDQEDRVPNSRRLDTGAGLSGGGDLSADRTIIATHLEYIVPVAWGDAMVASELIFIHVFPIAVDFADDWAGSVGKAITPPTGTACVLTINKNGAPVGTISISTTGVFTFTTTGTTVSFAIGDYMTITGPAAASAAAKVGISLKGSKP